MAAVAVTALLAGACGDSGGKGAADGRVAIVASFYPVAWATAKVGGDRVTVANLTPIGAEPHDLELTTDRVDEVLDADVVLVMGDGFQPALEEVAAKRDRATVELLAAVVGEAGDSESGDPHIWLDPILMSELLDEVAAALSVADAGGRGTYETNAKRLQQRLAELDTQYEAGLARCRSDVIVTSHDAFGWLAKRYGLTQQAIAGIDPEAEPDPQRLAELADLARAEGVTTVFTETLVSPEVAHALAREAGGLKTEVLDPLEGLAGEAEREGADYFSVMADNLTKLERALRCEAAPRP